MSIATGESLFIARIDRETLVARAGRPARIVAKVNALVDEDVVQALLAASDAGVVIDLIVRGICCLRPGVPRVSEQVRVRSIVGRFLEHSRLWYFSHDGEPEYFVGSADWMPRNLDRRVEVFAPVYDERLRRRLDALIVLWLADERQSWELGPDGTWHRLSPDSEARGPHEVLIKEPWGPQDSE